MGSFCVPSCEFHGLWNGLRDYLLLRNFLPVFAERCFAVTTEWTAPLSTRKSIVSFPSLTGIKGLAREIGDASGPLQSSPISVSSDYPFCPFVSRGCSFSQCPSCLQLWYFWKGLNPHPHPQPHPWNPSCPLPLACPDNGFSNFSWLFSFSSTSSLSLQASLGKQPSPPLLLYSGVSFWKQVPTSQQKAC